jgi:hypothetical protein
VTIKVSIVLTSCCCLELVPEVPPDSLHAVTNLGSQLDHTRVFHFILERQTPCAVQSSLIREEKNGYVLFQLATEEIRGPEVGGCPMLGGGSLTLLVNSLHIAYLYERLVLVQVCNYLLAKTKNKQTNSRST